METEVESTTHAYAPVALPDYFNKF